MGARIKCISYIVPEQRLSNEELSNKFPEWDVEKIASKTGIMSRYIAAETEFASDLAIKSGQKLFEEHNVSPTEIDFLLFCTQSPDYLLPTTACIIQDKLNLSNTIGALDFNLGCSGFVYGLSIAKGLIESQQAKNILLITAETYSKFIHSDDKGNRTIFGDAAAATLITYDQNNMIDHFVFGTDGNGAENLMVKRGGCRYLNRNESSEYIYGEFNENFLYMNGSEIFVFTLKAVPVLIESVLSKSKLSKSEVDLFIFHQANKFMLESLRKKIGISENKFYYQIENVGNTVSSTVPIALYHAINNKMISSGNKILLAGFGVGYSWAGNMLYF